MKIVFRGKFSRWLRIRCQKRYFRSQTNYRRRKRWSSFGIKHSKMIHFLLLSPLSSSKAWVLAPDSKSAWKITPENLLYESFMSRFRLEQFKFVKITDFRISWKMVYFCRFNRIRTENIQISHRIRDQRKNLPQNPFSIRRFIVVFRCYSYLRKFELSKIRWSRFSDN